MFCPTCGTQLNKIPVETNQGGRFEVDHCPACGGTWFDPYEINRIPLHEVMTLVDHTVGGKNHAVRLKKQLCPNDHLELFPFKGEAVPIGVKLLWCKRCLGIWATQKDLLEFKHHQEETISAYDIGNKFFPTLRTVFIPVITFVFLLAATASTILTLQESQEQRTFAKSQISNLQTDLRSSQSLFMHFNTSLPVSSSIIYGQSSLEMTEAVISSMPTTSHGLLLPNLKPGTDYLYRLKLTDSLGRSFTSDLYSFSTR